MAATTNQSAKLYCSQMKLIYVHLTLLLYGSVMGLVGAASRSGNGRSSRFYMNSCTLQRGRCTYRVHLTGTCGTNKIPFTTNVVQNDNYNERVNDIEKQFTDVSTDHTQRIKTLEKKISNLVNGPNTLYYYSPKPVPSPEVGGATQTGTGSDVTITSSGRRRHRHHGRERHNHHENRIHQFEEDPDRKENRLLNELHTTFSDLRTDLSTSRSRVADLERQLEDSRAKLNRSQTDLAATTAKLLGTEEQLAEAQREKQRLQERLHETQRECNHTREQLVSTRRQVRTQGLKLAKNERENALLRAQIAELRALLETTRRLLSEALRKYHELNVRHEATNKELDFKNKQLIVCYRGKTASMCGFEDDTICGFTQADNSTDFHDWLRHSGATPSGWTGPRIDHTCGNDKGHYMYVEASTRGEGQNAHLISPKYQGMSEQCLEFYYHMYGRDIGTLHVYTQVVEGEEFNPVWRAYGNQGNLWTRARIAIPVDVVKKGYRVIFAAILEYGYLGDIAIDDVRVFDGECYHVMTAEEMSKKFNITFPPPSTTTTRPTKAP